MEVQRALAGRDDVRLVAIMPGTPAALREQRARLGLTALLLADPTWSTYRAWAFPRGSFRDIWLSPRTIRTYLGLAARGYRPRRPEQDVYQLGGDVLIDARGLVAWIHRSRHPADRPPIDELLRRVNAVVGAR